MRRSVVARCLIVLMILVGFIPEGHAQIPGGWTGSAIGGSSPGSFNASTGNVTGGGADITGTSDQFEFVSSAFSGDGALVAKVASFTGTALSASAKAGLMWRSDTTATAAHVSVLVTAGTGVEFAYRSATGGTTTVKIVTGIVAPTWLKLVRSGAQFSGYYSSDGVTWNQVGTKVSLAAIPASAQAGLAVTSFNQGTGATAQFTNVALAANTAPTVAVAAAVNPSPLVGSRALLSVLGADDGVENNLIYNWATTGTPPAPVLFGANGTNAAKKVTAIFTASGDYDFTVTITDGSGLTVTSSCSLNVTIPAGVNVVQYHNDFASDGLNSQETQITPGNVNTAQFQRQYSTPVDGQIYTQPLYAHGVNITTGNLPGVQNVVYVATEHNTLYAIAAVGGNVLWSTSFLNTADPQVNLLGATNIATMTAADAGPADVSPEIGITSTPALDLENGYLYVCPKSRQIVAGVGHFVHSVFKVDIHSGAIVAGRILADTIGNWDTPSYAYRTTDTGTGTDPYCLGNGTGAITVNGESRVYFNASRQFNRASLLLANGSLYVASASHGDVGPYHGWVIRCDPDTLAITGAFNACPNGGEGGGGIWMSGGIPLVDTNGDIYVVTGNGAFGGNTNNGLDSNGFPLDGNYGDCFIRITDDPSSSPTNQNINGWGMKVADYFTPQNNANLDARDADLGSGAPIILPDSAGSALHPHLLVAAGKDGTIYLLDRDNMGKFGATDNVVQEWGNTATTGINSSYGTPAFFNGTAYWFPGYGGNGRSYAISNAAFPTNGQYTSQATGWFGTLNGTVSISANGTTNGVVWTQLRETSQLEAFDATNLASLLWTSSDAGSRDQLPGTATKFTTPTIAEGQVFTNSQGPGAPGGATGYLSAYGPPIPPTSIPAAPSGLTAVADVFNVVNLSWNDNSFNEDQFDIERSDDAGATWTQVGIASANATIYTDTGTLATTTYQYRVRAHNLYLGNSYSGYSNVFTVATPNAPISGTGDGIAAAYYNDTGSNHLTGTPALTRIDPTINFNWGGGSPDPTIGADHFSVKWTGKIQAQYTDTYTFYTESEDGVRLWINGQLLIDNWTTHVPTENTATIQLSAGQLYTFEMDMFAGTGNAQAQLLWASTATTEQPVPQSQLYSGLAPAAPTNLTVTPASGTQLNLSWTDNSNNETGFSIERKTEVGGTYTVVATVNPNVTTYVDGGLLPNTNYYYRIQATNFVANSAYSNEATALTPVPPLRATDVAATNITTSSITLTWTNNATNADGYRIVRNTPVSSIVVAPTLSPDATTFTDVGAVAGIASGTGYDYHIYCYNLAGYSDFGGAHTATLTLAPANLAATCADRAVNLTWTATDYNGDDADLSYNVYRGTSPGNETLIASDVDDPDYQDTGLLYGRTYYYKVCAVDLGGNSAFSSEVHATPTLPSSLQVTYGSAGDVPIAAGNLTATNHTVNLALNFAPSVGTNLTLVKNYGLNFIQGNFSNLAQGQKVVLPYNGVNYTFVANYYGGSGRDLVLQWADVRPLAWGSNNLGQLGNGSVVDSAVPAAVVTTGVLSGKTVVAMAVGTAHSVALCSDGTLAAWGANAHGQLGNNSTTDSSVPVAVDLTGMLAGKTVVAIAAGNHHSLALCSDGTLAAWGANAHGQLGNNGTTDSSAPVAVDLSGVLAGKMVVAIASGDEFNLALCTDGTVAGWGANTNGQLGNNSTTDSSAPVAVNTAAGSALSGETVLVMAAGAGHSMALCVDGTLVAWGANTNGQLGNNSTTDSSVPVAVNVAAGSALSGETVTAMAAGAGHSVALCADGTVVAWGANTNGQLGNISTTDSSLPVAVNIAAGSALSGETVTALAAGADYTLALCADGTVAAWGGNDFGQLGNNSTTDSSLPVAVSAVSLATGERWVLVANGEAAWHALALVAEPPTPKIDVQQPVGTSLVDGTSTVNFGPASVSAPQDLVFTVVNAGDVSLTGLAYSMDGTNAGEFVVLGTPDTAVDPGDSTTVTVRFTPTVSGARTAALHIASNDPNDNPFDLALSGTGVLTPVVSTFAATAVTATTATLQGTVNANSYDSTVSFDYGVDTSYGVNVAGTPSPVTGIVATPVSATLAGLSPGTTYHFRVNGVNTSGATAGTDLTFTTASTIPASYGSATDVPVTAGSFTATNGTVNLALNFAPSVGTNLTIVKNTGLNFIHGAFGNLAQGQTVVLPYNGVNYTFVANYYGGSGRDLVLQWANVRPLAWGSDNLGQLGNGGVVDSAVPEAVVTTGVLNGKTVVAMAVGAAHSLVLCSDGTLAAWGDNFYGESGNGSNTNASAPAAVDLSGVLLGKTVVAIATGAHHSLALCSDGTLAAWGANANGELGNNSTTDSSVPMVVDRSGVLAGKTVVAIACGDHFSLALCSDGTVAAWGANGNGQLGNNSTTDSNVPVAVNIAAGSALSGETVLAIAAGAGHSVALCVDGTVVAWGANANGQLGNGSTTDSSVPVAVDTSVSSALHGETVTAMAAGTGHSVALCADGTVVAWGANAVGQLGNNSTTDSSVPVAVDTSASSALHGETVTAIAAGADHTLALCADGTMAAWGANGLGQLGNNNLLESDVPATVSAVSLAAGERWVLVANGEGALHALALAAAAPASKIDVQQPAGTSLVDGTSTVDFGTAPVGNAQDLVVTVANVGAAPLIGLAYSIDGANAGEFAVVGTPATAVAVGGSTTVTVRFTPAVLGARVAALHIASNDPDDNPFDLALSGTGVMTPAVNTLAATAITATGATLNGTVNANNNDSTVSFDYGVDTSYGVNVAGTPSPVTGTVATAVSVTLGGLSPGTTYHFRVNGVNASGATAGTDVTFTTDSTIPATYGSATDVPVMASSFTATNGTVNLALNFAPVAGTNLTVVKNTGLNFIHGAFGNLAQGQTVVLPYNGVNYTFVANYYGGSGRDLVLQWAKVRPLAWGDDSNGQLGNNSTSNSSVPVAVVSSGVLAGKTIIALAAGQYHSLALCSDGTVAAWGLNDAGQLGNNSTTDSGVPVAVDLTGVLAGKTVVAIAAGDHFSLALCSDGTLAAWGFNANGQLGNNSTTSSSLPVAINHSGALGGKTVVGIAAGGAYGLALCSDGTLAAWGYNGHGELGNGSTADSSIPLPVNAGVLSSRQVVAISAGSNHNLVLCSDGTLATWGYNASGQLGNDGSTDNAIPSLVDTTGVLLNKPVAVIAAGGFHSLVLCTDGTLTAWGDNTSGQLGNNSNTNSSVPVLVNVSTGSALSGETITAIAAGRLSSLALCSDGTLTAWGDNSFGQLGNNNGPVSSSLPVAVNADSLASGERWILTSGGEGPLHVLALAAAPPASKIDVQQPTGTSLVDGTSTVDFGATLVGNAQDLIFTVANVGAAPLTGVAYSIDGANAGEFVVLGTLDTAVAVGGSTTVTVRFTPAAVGARTGALHVASNDPDDNPFDLALSGAGAMTPAVSTLAATAITATSATLNGTVNANNSDSTVTFDYGADTSYGINVAGVPSPVTGVVATSVSATLGGLSPGTTYHFRVNGVNASGATAGTDVTFTTDSTIPATYGSATDVPVTAGSFTATNGTVNLALNFAPAAGTNLIIVKNTGLSFIHGAFSNLAQGQAVVLPYNGVNYAFVVNYYGGSGRDLVLQWANVRPLAWGDDSNGQLGNNSTINSNVPVAMVSSGVLAGKTIIALAAGQYHSLALCADGTLVAWGANGNGQLGNNSTTDSSVPVAVDLTGVLAGKTVVAVAAGTHHSLALCSDGTLATWGANANGELGNNSTTDSSAPVAVDLTGVLAGKTVVAIASGDQFNLALCSDGTVAAWGANGNGQLGNNSTTDSSAPVAVNIAAGSALSGKSVLAVAAGSGHSLALCTNGTVVAWGANANGQLGNNSTTDSSVPVAVNVAAGSALSGETVTAIAAGTGHNVALCVDGTVVAWGANANGQLGNGSITDSSVSVAVNAAGGSALSGETVTALAAGADHTLALCADGTVAAWGADGLGQLGNNGTTDSGLPVAVSAASLAPGERWVMVANGEGAWHALALAAAPPASKIDVQQPAGTSLVDGTSTVDFGTALVGNAQDLVFTVVNTGVAPLTGLAYNFDGTNAGEFAVVGTPDTAVAIGGSTTVTVRFTPAAPGARTAALHIASNDADDTSFDLTLNGAGVMAPSVTTLTATAITATGATLRGTVNANNNDSTVSFDYGADTNYGTNVAGTPSPVTGTVATAVSVTLSGLNSATTYHFRVNGVNTFGATPGTDLTFTTLSTASALSNLTLSAGALSPVFDGGTMLYTVTVPDTTASIFVTPVVADITSTVQVNGAPVTSGSASDPINLNTGSNTIHVLATAQDGVTTTDYVVALTRLTNLQTWRQTYFSTTVNSGSAADAFDSTGDGVPNLMKYAFGLDPTSAASMQLPQPVLSGDVMTIAFTEPAGVGGITYGAEWTESLTPPNWTAVPDTGVAPNHIFSTSVTGHSALFMRLKVSEP